MDNPKSLAIYGGGFDPPHAGHDLCVQTLLHHVDLVLVVPCGTPVHKKASNSSIETRLGWCEAWLERYKDRVDIVDWEIMGEMSGLTCDLAERVEEEYPDFVRYVAIGADQLRDFPKWTGCKKIFKHADIIALQRGGVETKQEYLQWVFNQGGKVKTIYGEIDAIECSSSEIREAIENGTQGWQELLAPGVAQKIKV